MYPCFVGVCRRWLESHHFPQVWRRVWLPSEWHVPWIASCFTFCWWRMVLKGTLYNGIQHLFVPSNKVHHPYSLAFFNCILLRFVFGIIPFDIDCDLPVVSCILPVCLTSPSIVCFAVFVASSNLLSTFWLTCVLRVYRQGHSAVPNQRNQVQMDHLRRGLGSITALWANFCRRPQG